MRQLILKYSNFSSSFPELFTKHGGALLTGQYLINETVKVQMTELSVCVWFFCDD